MRGRAKQKTPQQWRKLVKMEAEVEVEKWWVVGNESKEEESREERDR